MSAHVLLNLSNKLGKSDKMRGLPSILLLFRNKFNKFNEKSQYAMLIRYPRTVRVLRQKTLLRQVMMKTSRTRKLGFSRICANDL